MHSNTQTKDIPEIFSSGTNGSIDDILTCAAANLLLWPKQLYIAADLAAAVLTYLHKPKCLHRDVKSACCSRWTVRQAVN